MSLSLAGLFLASAALAAPPEISPDGRTLLHEGTPVFLNAATPWHILARLDREETLLYLDARAAQGFNGLLLSLLVADDFHTGTSANASGDEPFLAPGDFSRPNEAYFAHVDWFLEEAARRDFWVLLEPAYLGYDCEIEGFCAAMRRAGPAVLRDYGRWLGERYARYDHLIWVDGGDADAAARGALEEVEAVAGGLRETSPDQLHTAHCNRGNSAVDCYDRPWLDLNTTYADCASTPRAVLADFQRTPARPFLYLEGWYEGEHSTSAVCLRSQAYWAVLGGAFGHCYGNRPLWDFWEGWQEALDAPGARSMKAFGELLRSRVFARLVPDWSHRLLVDGYGDLDDGSHAAAALTGDKTTLIVYTPTQRTLRVDARELAGEDVVAWWFDPSAGTAIYLDTFRPAAPREFSPPFAGDWVLVLDAEDAELPAPGAGSGIGDSTSIGAVKDRYHRR